MPKRYPFLFLFITVALVASCCIYVCAENEVLLQAKVDKDKMSLGDTLTFIVILSGEFKSSPSIKLPELDGFGVISSARSQNISIIKSQTKISTEFVYILKPAKTGRLTIGKCTLLLNKRSYATEPIEIEVLEAKEMPEEGPPVKLDASKGLTL